MTSSGNRGRVAITGANGTIGYACVAYALRQGYSVRCIVRSADAIETLSRGPSLQQFKDRIEYATVHDNTIPDAYDSVLSDVQYVIHVAGVWPTPDKHPDNDIYLPFVKSMDNILSAARKSGTVKRIIFTQAGAAMVHPGDGDTLGTAMNIPLNEHTPVDPRLLSLQPPLPSVHHAYCAGKAKCMTHLKNLRSSLDTTISLVQVIPGTVMGPSELITTKSDARKKMDRMSRALLFNEPKPRYLFGFVHVEDCARVHVEALDGAKLSEEKLPDWLIAAAPSDKEKSGEEIWKEAGDVVSGGFPEEVERGLFKVGRDNMPLNMPYYVASEFTEGTLLGGKRFRGLNECIREVADWYVGLRD